MKRKFYTLAGTVLFLIPLFQYFLWIKAAGRGGSQQESVEIFLAFFPSFLRNVTLLTLADIVFCFLAIIFTAVSAGVKGTMWKILNRVVMIAAALLLFLNLFSLM